jgi:transposase-like protein
VKSCPKCGSSDNYRLTRGARFRCKQCKCDFTATSKTALRYHKMPLEKYELAFEAFRKGSTAMAVAALIHCDYKTAWRLRRIAIQQFEESRRGNASVSA